MSMFKLAPRERRRLVISRGNFTKKKKKLNRDGFLIKRPIEKGL